MSRTAAFVVLAVLALLILAGIWFPAHTQGDQPVTAGSVPQSEFVPVVPVSIPHFEGMPVDIPHSSPTPAAPVASVIPSASLRWGASGPVRSPAPQAAKSVTGALTGVASWYRYIPGGAAAGPALRLALGPGWRGHSVAVCRTDGGAMACVRVTLSDFMRADRLIDLDSRSFAALMPLSRGLVTVEVTP